MKRLLLCFILLGSSAHAKLNLEKIARDYTEKHIQDVKAPGIIVGVIKKDKIIYSKGFGKRNIEKNFDVNERTLFRIGSLTKTFTGTAIMILRDKGQLSLDTLVEEYIPELSGLTYTYPGAPKITLRHLLTHSSSLVRHPQPVNQSIEGLIEALISPDLNTPVFITSWYPGHAYQYSNIGIALLGEVITRVSGKSVSTFIKDEILEPLEMHNTFWSEDEIDLDLRSYAYDWDNLFQHWRRRADWDLKGYSAAGSIYSNLEDLSKWMSLQFKTYPQDNPAILNPFSLNEMHTVQRLKRESSSAGGVGVIWNISNSKGNTVISHNGKTYGYRTAFSFDKSKEIGVVVMASNLNANADSFANGLLEQLQNSIKQTYADKFKPILPHLVNILKLDAGQDLQSVFDKSLFDYLGEDGWREILKTLNQEYGEPVSVIKIKGRSPYKAYLTLQTTKGKLTYELTMSSVEKDRISGILKIGFE